MERLTFEGNFCDIAQCTSTPGGNFCEDVTCSARKVWERLKAYEDSRLTPERCAEFARADAEGRYIVMRDAEQEGVARLRELAEADKDGRVVVLPCKVGDMVWFNTYKDNGKTCIGIQPHKVTRVSTSIIVPGEIVDAGIPVDQFGKAVFLTKEEADKADTNPLAESPILTIDGVKRDGN